MLKTALSSLSVECVERAEVALPFNALSWRCSCPICRVDSAVINATSDNVVIEEERDTELQYRSGANLLCAAAPLVEAVPPVLLGCSSGNSSTSNATAAGRPQPHEWCAALVLSCIA